MSLPASPLISSSEEISPESAPVEISPEAAPEEINPCASAYEESPPYYVFTSYLDNSGEHAPDGVSVLPFHLLARNCLSTLQCCQQRRCMA